MMMVILAGCSPQKRLARLLVRFPPDTTATTETTHRDSIIDLVIEGDTSTSVSPVFVPYLDVDSILKLLKLNSTQQGVIDSLNKELVNSFDISPVYNETEFAQSKAWVENGILNSELFQKDTIAPVLVEDAITDNTTTNNIPYPVIEKVGQFWKHGFLVLVGLILIGLTLWFLLKR